MQALWDSSPRTPSTDKFASDFARQAPKTLISVSSLAQESSEKGVDNTLTVRFGDYTDLDGQKDQTVY